MSMCGGAGGIQRYEYSTKVQQRHRRPVRFSEPPSHPSRLNEPQRGACHHFASKGLRVRVPLAPPVFLLVSGGFGATMVDLELPRRGFGGHMGESVPCATRFSSAGRNTAAVSGLSIVTVRPCPPMGRWRYSVTGRPVVRLADPSHRSLSVEVGSLQSRGLAALGPWAARVLAALRAAAKLSAGSLDSGEACR
jgi:hypothetical protein